MKKKIVFSGVQPSGSITIGNYIGCLSQWRYLQKKYDCIYCIADLHSMTVIKNYKKLKTMTLDIIAMYIACGVNPLKSIIFIQSHVIEHTYLNWILNCYTNYGELKRMSQFKNKISNTNKNINIGLLNYPVLMASDILLYKSNIVPVGCDQLQHLELTKKIAKRFNSIHKKKIFNIPNALISNNKSCIMSLLNPNKKMSKSDVNNNNVIYLLENENSIINKIQNAVTDSDIPPSIHYDPILKPGVSNLLNILSCINKISISKLEKKFYNKNYINFKKYLSDSLIYKLKSFQNKYFNLRKEEDYLLKIASDGAKKARNKAQININEIYKKINFS
ncbi:MAG: tryptophan--tRNA ligase [Candidatus Makana argininalis]